MPDYGKAAAAKKRYVLAKAFTGLSWGLIGPFAYIVVGEVAGAAGLSLFTAIRAIVAAGTMYITGVFADKYGRRLSHAIAMMIIGAYCFMISIATSLLHVILAAILVGLGESFVVGPLDSWIADELKRHNMEYLLEDCFSKGYSANIGCQAASTLLATLIAMYYGIRAPLILSAITSYAVGALVLALLWENWGSVERRIKDIFIKGVAVYKEDPVLLLLVASACCGTYFLMMYGIAYPNLLFEVASMQIGSSAAKFIVGSLWSVEALITAAFCAVLPIKIGEKVGALMGAAILSLAASLITIIMALQQSWLVITLLVLIDFPLYYCRAPLQSAVLNRLIPSEVRASATSALATIARATAGLLAFVSAAAILGVRGLILSSGCVLFCTVPILIGAHILLTKRENGIH